MVFQFTRPVKEVRATLARGRQAFREASIEAIGGLPPLAVPLLVKAVERVFVRSCSTAVSFSAPESAGADGEVFTTPPAERPKTDSAGGSITCAGSPTAIPSSAGSSSSTN